MTRTQKALISLILPAALFGTRSTFANPPSGLSFSPLKFELPKASVTALPNGMKVYLLEDHELPIVKATAYIRTGAVYVPGEKAGLASLFGATQRTGGTHGRTPVAINETLDRLAASVETSVSTEYATASLSVLKPDLDSGLAIFADVLMNPEFRQEQVDLEKAQLIEGIRRRNDDPTGLAFREFVKRIYGADHPYGREATIESVGRLTREDLIAFHRRYYRPNNVMLAISGDFPKEEIIGRLKKVFADWKSGEVTLPTVPTVRPDGSGGGARAVYTIQKAVPQSSILIGELGAARHDPDRITVEVMNYILGGGDFSSRLVREVRSDRGLAYSVGSIFSFRDHAGILGAYSLTRAGATAEATELMLKILTQMRTEPVSEEELRDAQQSLVNSFVFRFDDSHEVVKQQVEFDYYKYPKGWLENYPKRVQAVTREQLLAVARKFLHPDHAVVLVVGNRDQFDAPLTKFGSVQTITPTENTAARR